MSITREEALEYHSRPRVGKLSTVPHKPCSTQYDLSLAYSPGVAEPCREIFKNPDDVYLYTNKSNLVAVVSNGTAVLGLGDLGALASKPVMEGKAVLFKRFADVDVYDIELDSTNTEEIINAVKLIAPSFGGINLEDIKAPECFEIESRLRAMLDIPVFHDDQHGTAIISTAALLNALELTGKRIQDIKVVVNGAGAAGVACSRLYIEVGVLPANLIMCDTKGVIHKDRGNLPPHKAEFALDTPHRTLAEAMVGADMFLGLSAKGAVDADMLRSMNRDPIVFALANPDPEITYPEALASREDVIMATGRSDYPNQVNNVLGFPFIFRGALDVRAREINEEMKVAAARAIATLAKEDVPEAVLRAYGDDSLGFGRTYIIPKPFDPRVMLRVASAVARAAIESGVARIKVDDPAAWEQNYIGELERRLGHHMELLRMVHQRARTQPRRIVYAEGENPRVLRAVKSVRSQGLAVPLLIGEPSVIRERAAAIDLDLEGIEIIDPNQNPRLPELQNALHVLRNRKGMTQDLARTELHHNEVVLGSMLVRAGIADGLVCGADKHYPVSLKPVMELLYETGIGQKDAIAAGVYMLVFKERVLFLADCTVNPNPTASQLADIARGTARIARIFNIEPRVAMLSFSNFGSVRHDAAVDKVRAAVRLLHEQGTDFPVDGEMQADTALDRDVLRDTFPFNCLEDEANVLVMPDLNSSNIAYKLLLKLTDAVAVGPILLNTCHPVSIVQRNATVEDIVNLTAITVIDAQEHSRQRRRDESLRLPL